MSSGLFEIRPLIESHERAIADIKRDMVYYKQIQNDLKIDLVENADTNRRMVLAAIEVNRIALEAASDDMIRQLHAVRSDVGVKLVTLAATMVAWLIAVIVLI